MSRLGKLKMTGDKRLMKKLEHLASQKAAKRMLRTSVNAAATPIVKAIRSQEPVRTGLLKKAIKKKVVRGRNEFGYTAIMGADANVQGEINGKPYKPANIDHLVEFGAQLANGTTIPAQAPLQKGFDAGVGAASNAFNAKLKQKLEAEAKK
ncbi:MAG: HK97 gp10 family phage protein [Planctomycetes bacterium]|nr:HK97 gp10 family phage protein [Planctomycetota bacterium]